VLAGEFDTNSPPKVVAEFAALFPDTTLAILPGAGHFPWLDDPAWLVEKISAFLA
jgi:proline iminopeptidase